MQATLVWLMAVSGVAGLAMAQTNTFREEILLRIEEFRHFQFPERSQFTIETRFAVDPVPREERERLRRLAPTDRTSEYHLERIQLEEENRGARREIKIYTENDRTWRINTTMLTHPGAPFVDSARGQEGYWIYTQDQLQFANNLRALPSDVQFDPEIERNVARLVMASLTTGIAGASGIDIEITETYRSENGAKVSVRGSERSFLLEGTFEPNPLHDGYEFQINRVHVLDTDGNPVAVNDYKDWRHHPGLGIRLAHHRVTTLADGKFFSEYRVTYAGPLSHDVANLTKTPRPDGEDALRGPSTFRSVVDHTRGLRSIFDAESATLISEDSTRSSYSTGSRIVLGMLIIFASVGTFAAVRKGKHNP